MNSKLQICFHLARDEKDGEFQRIRKLQSNINTTICAEYREFHIVKINDFIRRPIYYLKLSAIVSGGKKIVMPVMIPGVRFSLVRFLNHQIGRLCGWVIGRILTPDYCIGETHGSYSFVLGVKQACLYTNMIIDIHGAYPEETEYSFGLKQQIDSHVAQLNEVESKIMDCANIIIGQSEAMFSHLEKKHNKYITNKVVYQCGADTQLFQYNSQFRIDVRKELNISSSDVVFVYLGGLHHWQLVDSVFEIFNQVVESNPPYFAKLLIITNESKSTVDSMAKYHGVHPNLLRVKSVVHNCVHKYLSASDIAFLLREDTIFNRVACPTKLGEYLACGVPVITTSIARNWHWTAGDYEVVCVVDHKKPLEAATIIKCFLNSKKNQSISQNREKCRALAQNKLSTSLDIKNIQAFFGDYNCEDTTNN